MVTFRRSLALLLCLIGVLALSACGSSKKSSSTSSSSGASTGSASTSTGSASTPASTSTGTTASGTPFVLGAICSCTGPQAAVLGDTGKVEQAWASWTNAHGGINGHPVKVIVKDDGQSTSVALQSAKELVEQDHVMAISDYSLVGTAFAPYVTSKGIPVVGGATPQPSFANPNWFPSAAGLIPLLVGTAGEAKGKKNLGVVYCAESPVCAQLVPLMQGIGKLFNLKVTPQKISGTAPNYTAPCLALKGAGVDALYIADNGPIVARVIADCHQQGYKPVNIGQASTTTNALLKNSAFDSSLKNETLGGVSPPLNFTPGKPAFTPCWYTGKVAGGTIVSTNGNKPTCLPAAQTAALLKAIGQA
jgi:branched-chain amino acid transport system substrate-binding protein